MAGTLWLVVNAASGSNSAEALEKVMQALASAGHPAERVLRFPDDTLPRPADLMRAGVGILAIFTGDGTANSQISLLHGWDGMVLVLPGGTQNLLAKALHGDDCTVESIAGRLGTGGMRPTRRKVVRTSHGDALCEVLAGPGATWSDVREEIRDRNITGFAAALGEAVHRTAAGAGVIVAEPRIGLAEGYRAVCLRPADSGMGVFGYHAQDLGEVARHVGAILSWDFRAGPHDTLGEHAHIRCTSDEPIDLMIDGERVTASRDERFEIVDCDVNFLSGAAS